MQAAAGEDEELQGVLQKHLLRSAGAEAVDALLRFHVRSVFRVLAALHLEWHVATAHLVTRDVGVLISLAACSLVWSAH